MPCCPAATCRIAIATRCAPILPGVIRSCRPSWSAPSRAVTACVPYKLLEGVRTTKDLGEDFGAGLTERELAWFVEHEWARRADDVLWRRTKCGLAMTPVQRARVAQRLAGAASA